MAMTTQESLRDDILAVVRSSSDFGRGTCSVVDEAYTDDEVIEHLLARHGGQLPDVEQALYAMHVVHSRFENGE